MKEDTYKITRLEQAIILKDSLIQQLEKNTKNLNEEIVLTRARNDNIRIEYNRKLNDMEFTLENVKRDKEMENMQIKGEYDSRIRHLEQTLMISKNELKNKETMWNEELEHKNSKLKEYKALLLELETQLELEKNKQEVKDQYNEILNTKEIELENTLKELNEYKANQKLLKEKIEVLEELVKKTDDKSLVIQQIENNEDELIRVKNELAKEREENERLRNELNKEVIRSKAKLVPSFGSVELQNLKKIGPIKDSVDELREYFDRGPPNMDESIIRAKVCFNIIIGK